jgi:hypothetical protein
MRTLNTGLSLFATLGAGLRDPLLIANETESRPGLDPGHTVKRASKKKYTLPHDPPTINVGLAPEVSCSRCVDDLSAKVNRRVLARSMRRTETSAFGA